MSKGELAGALQYLNGRKLPGMDQQQIPATSRGGSSPQNPAQTPVSSRRGGMRHSEGAATDREGSTPQNPKKASHLDFGRINSDVFATDRAPFISVCGVLEPLELLSGVWERGSLLCMHTFVKECMLSVYVVEARDLKGWHLVLRDYFSGKLL